VAIVSDSGLVDTHCHLNFDVFDPDRDVVIERARNHGITRILIPGIDIQTSTSAIKLAHIYPEVYASIGIHPNQGLDWTSDSISELKKLAGDVKVIAIGEIGLDYYRDRTPKELQRSIFKQQLDLAAELGLPVIIHNRNASEDILHILHEWHTLLTKSTLELAGNPGVLHSFSGDETQANDVSLLNFKMGITGPVTFAKSQNLQSLIGVIAIGNLLIETDAPFLSPHPYRGKRNEPANVRIVAEKIAEIKNTSLDNVAKITTATADKLFRWRVSH
jgi:TatD DNase family protein